MLFTVGRCPPIPVIERTHVDNVLALPGNRVTYTCEDGYMLSNREAQYTIECRDTQWNHVADVTCEGEYSR